MAVLEQQQARTRPPRPRYLVPAAIVAVLALIGGYAIYHLLGGRPGGTIWSAEFDGPAGSQPSTQDWTFTTGTSYPGGAPQFGTGEIQTYTSDPANVRLDGNGNLVIAATRDPSGAWRSARIETRRTDFQPAAGQAIEVAARIQVPPPARGYWPAFWMLGADFRGNYVNWPGVGEIDIMEHTARLPATVLGTIHCGTAPGGICNEGTGLGGRHTLPDGQPLAGAFHTFAIQWDRSSSPEEIRWYLDGRQYHSVRADAVDAATWAKATHHGFYILLNMAVGGALADPPDATTTPGAAMLVDSVSVSRL